ncbi:unnamed protein product, partial [marine sediment metagenome]
VKNVFKYKHANFFAKFSKFGPLRELNCHYSL